MAADRAGDRTDRHQVDDHRRPGAVRVLVGSIRTRIDWAMDRRALRKSAEKWRAELKVPAQSKIAVALDAKLQELQAGKTLDHQELLRIFAETKRKLDALGRDLAFLSVDIVGSTQMKQNEEPAAIQHDFIEYRKMVERVFARCRMLKAAWTPDGVMACFPSVNDAVQAGKDIIRELALFNRSEADQDRLLGSLRGQCRLRLFRRDHAARDMADRVIDVAGHMQKYADPNTVAVAQNIVEPLNDRAGFAPAKRVVDGYEVYTWRPAD